MNLRHPMVVLRSFSIKSIFCDKMDFVLFFWCGEMMNHMMKLMIITTVCKKPITTRLMMISVNEIIVSVEWENVTKYFLNTRVNK